MARRLADLLEEAERATRAECDADLLDAMRDELERVATAAVAGLDDELLPLRVTKDRLGKVLACERHLLATSHSYELSEPVMRGRILDRLLHHHVLGRGAATHGPALAIAEGAFDAERDDEAVAWLADNVEARRRLADDAAMFAEHLRTLGSIDPSWWPRCESRLRVDLAGRRVVCTAQLDLVVGGPPTAHPTVIFEAKSGAFGSDHRDGLFWYAALASLRHGVAPGGVIAWSGWDGASWYQPVSAQVLRAAVDRARRGITLLAELARGRPATETACRACGWCPERSVCATGAGGVEDVA